MKILIKQLEFECIIGLLEKERHTPQRVILDISISLDEENMVVDYAKSATLVEKIYKKEKFFTVEESLLRVCATLKEKYPKIQGISIQILKPDIMKNCRVGAKYRIKY